MNKLEIRNLNVSKAGQPLIAHLDLSVAPGEVFTLRGASGSGKSTLLNWIIGALDPVFSVRGELWLDGVRRDTLPIESRRSGVGHVGACAEGGFAFRCSPMP